MNIQYQQTGNQIQVPMNEMVNFVSNKLYEYDELIKATESIPEQSPYKDPIYYTTEEGKMVQIPTYIQKQVVEQYMKEKINSVQESQQPSQQLQQQLQPQLQPPQYQQLQQYQQQLQQYQQQPQQYQQQYQRQQYQPHLQYQYHDEYTFDSSKNKKNGSNIKLYLIIIGIILILFFLYKNYK